MSVTQTQIMVSPPSAPGSASVTKSKGSTEDKNNEKLMVALRIRPMKHEERSRGFKSIAEKVDERMVVLMDASNAKHRGGPGDPLRNRRSNDRQYVFDATFGADSTQHDVYNKTTEPLIRSVLEGYNATVFAYGATGSGKTYTMVGTPEHPGCMALALNKLFETMDKETEVVFKVTMSYLEIYNENIRDLLNPTSGHLDLRDDSKGRNITVAGLSEVATKNTEEVMRLLQKGNKERTQEPTAANKTSSRSHALLMVNVKQTAKSRALTKGAVKFGRLYMIDLAGSERASQTENRGKRLKEGAHINRSLLALGNVINALAEHKARGHVNYRDSKLTRLLKDALSGNCHTVMIAHISPTDRNRDESRNTLEYADRAKNISNKVRKNVLDVSYHVSQYQNIISDLRGEIGRLKEKIQVEGSLHGNSQGSGAKKAAEELKELRDQMVANFKDQMNLRHRLMEIDNHILSLSMEFERQNIIINEYETNKAKFAHDRAYKRRNRTAKRISEPENNGAKGDEEAYEADKEESGFEDNASDTKDDDFDDSQEAENFTPENSGENEDTISPVKNAQTPSSAKSSKVGVDATDDEDDDDSEEPEEVKQAWDELLLIQREQQRYSDIKYDLEQDLEQCKKKQAKLENELPKRISTEEEAEILSLLCKVHELEITKVEMQRDALLKEHEVRKRDLLILKYDKQRTLCDEIIERQRELIDAMETNKANTGASQTIPMPPELMELYNLYKQELETRNNKENQFVENLNNEIIRTPSMISLRGPELEDRSTISSRSQVLPPIKQENGSGEDRLFESAEDLENDEYGSLVRAGSQLSLQGPSSSATSAATKIPSLPPINKRRSIRRSNSFGYKSNRDQKTPGVSKLPRRLPTRRFSSADDKMSTKATNLSENTGPPQVKPKRKKSKYTDPFENKAITLARF